MPLFVVVLASMDRGDLANGAVRLNYETYLLDSAKFLSDCFSSQKKNIPVPKEYGMSETG
jgi:hypothetical protein